MRDHVSVGDLLVRFHEVINAGAHLELALNGAKVVLVAGFRLQQLVPAMKRVQDLYYYYYLLTLPMT
jgi:hypothetical protein